MSSRAERPVPETGKRVAELSEFEEEADKTLGGLAE